MPDISTTITTGAVPTKSALLSVETYLATAATAYLAERAANDPDPRVRMAATIGTIIVPGVFAVVRTWLKAQGATESTDVTSPPATDPASTTLISTSLPSGTKTEMATEGASSPAPAPSLAVDYDAMAASILKALAAARIKPAQTQSPTPERPAAPASLTPTPGTLAPADRGQKP